MIHTMFEMEQNATTGLQTREKYIQSMRFYLTVKRILDTDPECSEKCKIVFYKGINISDTAFCLHNIFLNVLIYDDISSQCIVLVGAGNK